MRADPHAAAAHVLMLVTAPQHVPRAVGCVPPWCCGHPFTPGQGRDEDVGGQFAFKTFVLPGLVGESQRLSVGCWTP